MVGENIQLSFRKGHKCKRKMWVRGVTAKIAVFFPVATGQSMGTAMPAAVAIPRPMGDDQRRVSNP